MSKERVCHTLNQGLGTRKMAARLGASDKKNVFECKFPTVCWRSLGIISRAMATVLGEFHGVILIDYFEKGKPLQEHIMHHYWTTSIFKILYLYLSNFVFFRLGCHSIHADGDIFPKFSLC